MSQTAVAEIVSRSSSDEQFVNLFLTEPDRALSSYDLTAEEQETLKSMDQERILKAANREPDARYCVVARVTRV